MALDPVCGMTVAPERAAAKVSHADVTYFFCCKSCADKFQAAPEKYLQSKAPAATSTSASSQLIQLGGPETARNWHRAHGQPFAPSLGPRASPPQCVKNPTTSARWIPK